MTDFVVGQSLQDRPACKQLITCKTDWSSQLMPPRAGAKKASPPGAHPPPDKQVQASLSTEQTDLPCYASSET